METPKEAAWLLFYGIGSFLYRIFISFRIILFVAAKFFFIGVILALWASISMLVMPLVKMFTFLLKNPAMKRKRVRILFACILPFCLLISALMFYPLPSHTLAQGVVWVPEEATVYSKADGMVIEQFVASGQQVARGTLLLRLEDPQLEATVRELEAKKEEFSARYDVSMQRDKAEALLLEETMAIIDAEYGRAKERQAALSLYADIDGTFILPQATELKGLFFRRGQPLGYILQHDTITVRAVVPQDDIEKVRSLTRAVTLRLASELEKELPAAVVREIPAADRELPSYALSLEGEENLPWIPARHSDHLPSRIFFSLNSLQQQCNPTE